MKVKLIFCTLFLLGFFPNALAEVLSSSNYNIEVTSINSGGEFSNSPSYYMEDTSGELDSGGLSGDNYATVAGYQKSPVVASTGSGGNGLVIPGVADPIEISNLNVSVSGGVTTISWDTDRPTNADLILGENVGGGGYTDELFTPHHSIQIEGVEIEGDYIFKIFAQDPFGNDNYNDAQLYSIARAESGAVEGSNQIVDGANIEVGGTIPEEIPKYIIEEVEDITGKGSNILPPEKEVINVGGDDKVIYDSGTSTLPQTKTILSYWYWYVLVIALIIFFFVFIRRRVK